MIIGIIGQSGSGKDTFAELLVSAHGYTHISLSAKMRELAKELYGSEVQLSREESSRFADELRSKHGPTYLVDSVLTGAPSHRVVLSGIYGTDEAEKVRAAGGAIVGIIAPDEIRYERIKQRGEFRDQAISSFGQFRMQAQRELGGGAFKGRVTIKDADYTLTNNATLDEFERQATLLIDRLLSR
jgi:dephospho-CoA kinase